ncbi:hypothetical protein FIV06_24060 [Labrenzia sp. THAF191b]|uniref:hypothetical protein n=1 Tax=unclassified Labrenzia TaxID=2648686 RepID=UPI00126967D6|nr:MULTISPECIES: hypothetical protein [unclassified Labrenzia]QFT00525.1 hypothetical protein FIV06_24060 [Labrenzia sp. THAF191b]QFT06838.1 hypothetical protein FIV05_24055 [Labrenzia sp. THAF191a]QFT18382.1 hypothetical protein FIV03_24070 [Labrenzia sp. THAF187b]
MSFLPQPDPLTRSRAIVTNAIDALDREVIRLKADKQADVAAHVEATMNALKNAYDIRLKERGNREGKERPCKTPS